MISFKHALVTGGGSGIGEAIALTLAEAGVAVTVSGRRKQELDRVAAQSRLISVAVADVTKEESIAAVHAEAEAGGKPFDIVIANAGIAGSSPAHKTSLTDWQHIIDVNLTGAFLTVKPALAGMAKRGAGRIIFVASIAGLRGGAYIAPYVASKHGVIGLARALGAELAKTGVTVNAVCPGFVETPMVEDSVKRIVEKTGRSADEALGTLVATNPQGRLIQADEIAATVLWLVGDGARSVNGQAISISGGDVA